MNTIKQEFSDPISGKTDDGLYAGQQFANNALDVAQNGLDELREKIPPKIGQASARLEHLAQVGVDRTHEMTEQVKRQAVRARESTAGYVREEPFKAVLIAAATGVVLAGALGLYVRSRFAHH